MTTRSSESTKTFFATKYPYSSGTVLGRFQGGTLSGENESVRRDLADSEIVPAFTDPTESAGSVKLVAKRIEYSISKPLNGKGGFLRRIRGVRRFT